MIDLGFAEYNENMLPALRVFDVSVNGDYVLVDHDVAAEVRGLWADDHMITVEHSGGDLTVRFHGRAAYQLPIVNVLRVTAPPSSPGFAAISHLIGGLAYKTERYRIGAGV